MALLKDAVIKSIDYYNSIPTYKACFLSPMEFKMQNPKGAYLLVLIEKGNC